MTLREIQEIIATGDGDDGHVLTIAESDITKPAVTFNFQPPSHTKVHNIVSNVQNVLKAEMEAQKTHPPKENIFDTPDVSSSWSMILPAIFGNTGGSIAPESLISMHSVPETDVITNNKKEETVTEKQTPDNEKGDFTKLIENITESYHIHNHDDESDDIDRDVDTYSQVEDLIEEELTNFASKTTNGILLDEESSSSVASKNPTTVQIKIEQTTEVFKPSTEKITSTTSSKPATMSTTLKSVPKIDKIVVIKRRPVSQTTTEIINTTLKPVATESEQITEVILTEVPLVTREPVLQINKDKETVTSKKPEMTNEKTKPTQRTTVMQTTTERINKIESTKPIITLKVNQTTVKPNIANEKPLFIRKPINQLNENEISVSTNKDLEIINEKLVERTTTPILKIKTEITTANSNPSTLKSETVTTTYKPAIIAEKIIQSAEKPILVDDTTVKTPLGSIVSADQLDKEINIIPEVTDKTESEMDTENYDYTTITNIETSDELEEITTEIERDTEVPTDVNVAPLDLNIKNNYSNIQTKGTANTESVTSKKVENSNPTTEKSSNTETTKSDLLQRVPSTTTKTEPITEKLKTATNSATTQKSKEVETTTVKIGTTPSIANNNTPSAQLNNKIVAHPVVTVANTEKNNEILKIKPNSPLESGVTEIENIEADVKVNSTTQKAIFEKKPLYQFINNQVVNNSLSTNSGLISKLSDQIKKSNETQTAKTTIKPTVDEQAKIKPVTDSTVFVKSTTPLINQNQNKVVIVKESAKNGTKDTEEKVAIMQENIQATTVKPAQNEKNQNTQTIGSHHSDINVIATTYKPFTNKPSTVLGQTNDLKDESVSIKDSKNKLSPASTEKNTTTKTTKPMLENILKEESAMVKVSGALLSDPQTTSKSKVDATTETNLHEQQITRRTTPESSFVKISSSNSNGLLNDPDTKNNVTEQNSNITSEPSLSTKPIIHNTVTDKPTQNTVEANPGLDIYQLLTQISMDLREPNNSYKPENISGSPFVNIVQDLLNPNVSEIAIVEDIPHDSFKTTTQNIINGEQESSSKISTISTTTNTLTSGASVTKNVESTTSKVVEETLSTTQKTSSEKPMLSTTAAKDSVITFLSEAIIEKDNIKSESLIKANASNIAISEHVSDKTQSSTAKTVTVPSRLSTTPFAPTEEKKDINQVTKSTTEILENLSESTTNLISQINDEDPQTTLFPTTYDEYSDSEENTYTTMDSSYYNDEESTREIETDQTTIIPIVQTTEKAQDPTTQKIIKSTTTRQTEELKIKQSTETTPAKIIATTVKLISQEEQKITSATPKIEVSTMEPNSKDQNTPLLALNQIKSNLTKENIKIERPHSTTETVIRKTTEAPKISTKREEPIKIVSTTEKIPEKTKTTPSVTTVENTKATAMTEDDELMEMLNKYSQMFKLPEDNYKGSDSESPTEPPKLSTQQASKYKETTNEKPNKETIKKADQLPKSNSTLINKANEKINILNITVTKTGVKDKVNMDNAEIDEVLSSIKKVSSSLKSPQIIKNNTKVAYDKIVYTHAELPNKEITNNNRLVLRKETLNTEVPVKQNITISSTKKPEYKVATTSDSIKSYIEIDAINTQLKTLNDLMSTKKETSTLAALPQTKSEDSTTSKSQVLQEKIDNLSKEIINKTHANENSSNSSIVERKNNTDVDSQWKLVPTVYPRNETLKPNTINNRVSIQNVELPLAYHRPQSPQNSVNGLKNYQSQHIGQIHLPVLNGREGLDKTTAGLSEDVFQFSELCNELAFRYWNAVSSSDNGIDPKRSLAVSPFAVTSILAMTFLGARGATSGEMNEILKLDDMVTFNPHIVFKNVTESIEVSKKSGVATSCFIREIFSDRAKGRLLSFYKERVQQFYSGHVEEVNFKVIGDVIRRRTNLLVKRHTWGKIPEYIKANNMILRPPLSIFSANIFQVS